MDNEILAYTLVTSPNKAELNTLVNNMIRQGGYQPYGAPFYAGSQFAQAMVTYSEEEEVPF